MKILHDHDADASVLNGNRDTTTVAPQALFLLNSELASRASANLAGSLLASTADDGGRVEMLYWTAYGRAASTAEVARALTFVRQSSDAERERAWSWLCQTVLASNEFIYVR